MIQQAMVKDDIKLKYIKVLSWGLDYIYIL